MLRSAACLHKNQSRSYLNHLVYGHGAFSECVQYEIPYCIDMSCRLTRNVNKLTNFIVKIPTHW
jgi:hypothetical protein